MGFTDDLERLLAEDSWSSWLPLNGSSRNPTPRVSGIYEVFVQETDAVEYVGQCGLRKERAGLRGRMGDLREVFSSVQMPYSDPHTASPCLWAFAQEGCSLQVRFFEAPDLYQDEQARKALETVRLAQVRIAQGRSPLANFGGMPPGCTKSSTRAGRERGAATRFSIADLGVVSRVWPNIEDASDEYAWSDWQPLGSSLPSDPGLYRLRGARGTVYVGQSRNLAQRIRDHGRGLKATTRSAKYKTMYDAGPLNISTAVVSASGRELDEREDHVIAAVVVAEGRVPDAQYLDKGRGKDTLG